jgi:hypothetical protein
MQPVRLDETSGIDYSRSAAPLTLGLYGAAAP